MCFVWFIQISNRDLAEKLGINEINYEITDPVAVIKKLLADHRNTTDIILQGQKQFDSQSGQRVYERMTSADQYLEMQSRLPADTVLFAVVMYIDDTWCSKTGKHTAKPLVVSLGT